MSTQRTYLDFAISIDDLGEGRYRSTVLEMPLGEGQARVSHEFTLPFAEDELERILAVLSGRQRVSTGERSQQARRFGEALFRAVFGGPVYTVYFSSRDRARAASGLRIKLSLENAGRLATIPWEFLRDPGVDFLALSRATPLVRYPRSLVIRPRPAFSPPLRVLVMVSSPSDLEPVDVQTEWNNLLAATENLRARGMLELELLDDASLRTLQRRLRTGEYHVFHYIGHSMFDPLTGQGMLALEDPFGENSSFPVRGEDLARELSEENAIRLVVLNSCQSGAEVRDDPFAGIASSSVARGIPAVVAMQYVISEQAAGAFSEEFYRAVAEGLPVDAAVSEARRAIGHATGGIEWATPVLYMRAADGMLFDFGRGEAETERPARRTALLAGIGGVVLLVLALLGFLIWRASEDDPPPSPEGDLVIESIRLEPRRPILGRKTFFQVTVRNDGSEPVGGFGYDLRGNVLDAEPSFRGEVAPISPGDSATIWIPHVYSWWGPFTALLRIDIDNVVAETDEFNNIAHHPVVIDRAPFEITFEELPDGANVDESMPLPDAAYEPWGFRLGAVPPDGEGCAEAVLWIMVEGNERYLSTGLPDDPAACNDGGLEVVLNYGPVSGVVTSFEAAGEGEYSLVAFGKNGDTLDLVADRLSAGEQELEISGGFPTRLEVARAVWQGVVGTPTQITAVALQEPVPVRPWD